MMKINSLYISAFGGIKNLSLDFSKGFNVVYGDNENGKTTIMSFVKMMFYGSERGASNLAKNIRKKYTPWDNSQMAGSIDFEVDGKGYRLEREFRSSNSTDKTTLCDIALGTRQAVSGDVGVKFFGISLAAFERSVFIGQFGFPESDTQAEGEINSKLSNIVSTGDESISFETVNARIQKAKNALKSKSGRTGEYDKNLKLLQEIKDGITKAEEKEKLIKDKQNKINSVQEEIFSLQSKAVSLKEKITAEQDIKNAGKLKSLLELKDKLDALNNTLKLEDGSIVDEMYLRKLRFCISKTNAAENKLKNKISEKELLEKAINTALNPPNDATVQNAEALKSDISLFEKQISEIDTKLLSLKDKADKIENELSKANLKKKPINLSLIIAGALSLLLGGIFIILNLSSVGFVTLGLGVVLALLSFVFKPFDRKKYNSLSSEQTGITYEIKSLETEKSGIENKLSLSKTRLDIINNALNLNVAAIENRQQMLKQLELDLSCLENERKEEENALFNLFSKYKKANTVEEILDSLEQISVVTQNQRELKTEISYILKDLNGISYEQAREKLEKIDMEDSVLSEDFDKIKEDYELILQSVTDKKAQIAALTAEIKSEERTYETADSLRKRLSDLSEKIKAQESFCDSLDKASEILLESFSELRSKYGSVLEKNATRIFEGLTKGKYNSMTISKAFEINVTESNVFGGREIEYLSSGATDQAYLSLRLAVSELISTEEKLPIMLDDSLAQYDDERTSSALEFFANRDDAQTIMFTCHKAICERAEELGANLISLKK